MNIHIKTWLGTTIIIIIAITAGMFVWKVYEMNSDVSVSVPQTIQIPKPKIKENNVGIANPASVFCEQNGGKLEIITAEDGSQSGMCKFSDGSQCEEWAFQRGECKQGNGQDVDNSSNWAEQKELNIKFKINKNDPISAVKNFYNWYNTIPYETVKQFASNDNRCNVLFPKLVKNSEYISNDLVVFLEENTIERCSGDPITCSQYIPNSVKYIEENTTENNSLVMITYDNKKISVSLKKINGSWKIIKIICE